MVSSLVSQVAVATSHFLRGFFFLVFRAFLYRLIIIKRDDYRRLVRGFATEDFFEQTAPLWTVLHNPNKIRGYEIDRQSDGKRERKERQT